jgi:hypothetical protein
MRGSRPSAQAAAESETSGGLRRGRTESGVRSRRGGSKIKTSRGGQQKGNREETGKEAGPMDGWRVCVVGRSRPKGTRCASSRARASPNRQLQSLHLVSEDSPRLGHDTLTTSLLQTPTTRHERDSLLARRRGRRLDSYAHDRPAISSSDVCC